MRRHLVPLDGSHDAEEAIAHAVALGRALSAETILLRVLEPERETCDSAVDSVSWRLARAEAAAYLAGWKSRLDEAGVAAEIDVREGRAAEQILEAARERQVDLVLLTAHGLGGIGEFGLGSTAQKLVAWGGTSLLLLRGTVGDAAPSLDLRYGRILVLVDGSHRADWALRTAASLARDQGGTLVVAHVVPVPEMAGLTPPSPDDLRLRDRIVARNREHARAYLDDVVRRLSDDALEVESRLLVAPAVGRTLAALARTEGMDLVVCGAHGRGCLGEACEWPYGSVATALLSLEGPPLLVLQDVPRPWLAAASAASTVLGSQPAPQA